ncbi:hypothetical protein E4631_24465 [Hymenobacter sp. UV11]|uniref:hypothetical protein n=1 Tax=Hymenobacter sp. UV11 TaxID=1849735 RepID=UPI00105C8761|nr:hypothetical protein [Hymenobacter sp. UV11]TDN35747.1 hypothetical protein A8B98_12560 [Hymenobacter sp. UV11]TFZ62789.1 hypothetical protein E4631_24465 [Hymenobacter sp. UV11]
MADFPAHAFSLEYRPDLGLLIGRWLQDVPPPALQGTYEAMLTAAQAHDNCRFWLLDLRRRPVAGPDLNEWFRDQFSPRIAAALDGPLFTTYLAGPHQRPPAESPAMELYLHREAALNAFPHLFEEEAEAVTWLRAEPAREGILRA